tara:strand:- start:158 stop:784 length:627 start_codon:yes stop_codon:yes gene_type:complete
MSHKNFINTLIFSFVLIFLSSCSTLKDINYMNKNIYLDKLESIDPSFKKNDTLLYVDIDKQSMIHLNKGKIQNVYPISSSSYGTGSKENSFKTPLGKHEIYKKIGYNLPENAILKGRVWNGAIADIIKEPIDTDFDHVTSRILWLDGLEIGKNKGKGIDSRNRFIYIHGTAEEGLIGKPASDGCIRMYNSDVIKLFDLVDEKAQVWIY